MAGAPNPMGDLTKQLKENLEAVERLRMRRAELRDLLSKEDAPAESMEAWSRELADACSAMTALERDRRTRILRGIQDGAPAEE